MLCIILRLDHLEEACRAFKGFHFDWRENDREENPEGREQLRTVI